MSEMLSMLQGAIAGRSPIVYVYSPEEERIVRAIKSIAEPLNQPVTTWSCVSTRRIRRNPGSGHSNQTFIGTISRE